MVHPSQSRASLAANLAAKACPPVTWAAAQFMAAPIWANSLLILVPSADKAPMRKTAIRAADQPVFDRSRAAFVAGE